MGGLLFTVYFELTVSLRCLSIWIVFPEMDDSEDAVPVRGRCSGLLLVGNKRHVAHGSPETPRSQRDCGIRDHRH